MDARELVVRAPRGVEELREVVPSRVGQDRRDDGAGPDAPGARLRPWMMLIVLGDDEFSPGANAQTRPLPFITLTDAAMASALPDPETLWAWAHVHVNRGITASDTEVVSNDRDALAARLGAAVASDADIAYSRIVCPRRLEPNKTYHAFVVPVFESGRLAGLGLDPSAAPNSTASAWKSNGADTKRGSLPIPCSAAP